MSTETASASETIAVKNPATGGVLYEIQDASEAEVRETYDRARAASAIIGAMSVRERVDETLKLMDYIRDNRESILDRVVAETGKCRMDAIITEIFSVLDMIDFYDKNAEKMLADQPVPTPLLLMGKKGKIVYEPLGVVLNISPWNYPFNQTFFPFLNIFLAGNAMIHKPSEVTPLKGLIEEVMEGSGFIENALQVVYGGRATGERLIDGVPDKILFTGSTRAGKQIMARAAEHLIPVELELGGKDPMLVFDDVNLERTVAGALWGGMTNCGQTCTAVERIYVQEGIYDEFVAKLRENAAKMVTPDQVEGPDRGGVHVGYMTAGFQLEKVASQVSEARAQGAEISGAGAPVSGTHVFPPTVVTKVKEDMRVQREETFGPVVTVLPFRNEEEAVKYANDSEYGLSASVWSTDLHRAERVARRIKTGNVSINNVLSTQAHAGLPFGGSKQSGFGRFKGAHGLHSFSNIKSVMVEKQGNKVEMNWHPYTEEKYQMFSKFLDVAFARGGGLLKIVKTALTGLKMESMANKIRY